MEINLNGKPPKAQTLDEANQLIKALWAIVRELKAKKQPNSKNSSLPPSKDKNAKNKSNIKRNAKRKKNPKKAGGQPGHAKHERALLPTEDVDHVVRCAPSKNCPCGGIITSTKLKRRHQQHEFPVIQPIVTEYQLYMGNCRACHKQHTGKLPTGISWSMLGPRATAMTAHLSGTYRMSKLNIAHMYQDIFSFRVSTGMICKAEKTVSKALQAPHDDAKAFIRSANERGVNADETSFKEKGKNQWAWVAIANTVAAFIIRKNRSQKVSKELLRTLAIWRKTSFGTQSPAGTLYMERIMTTVATCKLQGRNILSYLTNAVTHFISKTEPPSLLPAL